MSWTLTVGLDADKSDVGTVSATWTDPEYGDYTFSARGKLDSAGANAFVAAAIAKRNAWQTRKANEASLAATGLSLLNSTDPQVI